jgi:hypothetical protein
MKLKVIPPKSVTCEYCGASPGEQCILTLAPEVGPLSITWNHRTREQAVA